MLRSPTYLPTQTSAIPHGGATRDFLHHSDVFTILQTVCHIHNSKYSLKQFSVSRMDSMRLESQKTWCPIDCIIIVVPTPTDNIQSLAQSITLDSWYLLTILNLLVVELLCLPHSTPSQLLQNSVACIDCTRYSPARRLYRFHSLHWAYWAFLSHLLWWLAQLY